MDTEKRIEAIVNGKEESIDEGTTLLELISKRGLYPEIVAIEHNLHIVKRTDYSNIKIESDDKIEIVRFMVGG